MGPKQCGKTTLIKSLVKLFTGQNLSSTSGPITCVASRQRRITFFECPTSLDTMIDLAKVGYTYKHCIVTVRVAQHKIFRSESLYCIILQDSKGRERTNTGCYLLFVKYYGGREGVV